MSTEIDPLSDRWLVVEGNNDAHVIDILLHKCKEKELVSTPILHEARREPRSSIKGSMHFIMNVLETTNNRIEPMPAS